MNKGLLFWIKIFLVAISCLGFGHLPSALAQNSCRHIYSQNLFSEIPAWPIEVYKGRFHDEPVSFPIPAGSKLTFLGSGLMGGEVYRVTSIDGTSKIFKEYKRSLNARLDCFA